MQAVVAEALAGAPMEASIGNQVATILNQVVSTGKPPTQVEIQEVEAPVASDGMTAFYGKIKEIKENTKTK